MFAPFDYKAVWATGAAAASAVNVSGIKTNDVVLAICRWKAGEVAANVAAATFVVADGTITSASVDTDTYHLLVIWTHP